MAEGHRIIREWEDLRALTAFVNEYPVEAADYSLADDGVGRFPIILAATEAEPMQFVRFWNRLSQAPFLNEEQVRYIHLGLLLKDGANAYTLTFNHDEPAISDLLARLAKLVEGNELALKEVEGVNSGQWKVAQLRYFEEYGPRDWRKMISDLKDLVVSESGDLKFTTEPKEAAKLGGAGNARSNPSPKSSPSLTLWPVVVAALGLLWGWLKKRK